MMWWRNNEEQMSKILEICKNAIEAQHKRENDETYGDDDYGDGIAVGSSKIARSILQILEYKEMV
jgi:hypothetical protein